MKRLPAYPVYLALSTTGAFIFSMVFTATSLYEVTVANLNPLQLVLVGTVLEVSILTLNEKEAVQKHSLFFVKHC